MLESFSEIQGIGLLHNSNGRAFRCQKATFIYADNGRGKSTLATILRSAATDNASLITTRKTLDGTFLPRVVLQFASGHKVTFENGAWSEPRPELLVFDADFIERNVHSGGTVNTGHRKNLLEFALGEAAVQARAKAQNATNEAQSASKIEQDIQKQLSDHHVGSTFAVFEKLPLIADVSLQIQNYQRRILATGNVVTVLNKSVPQVAAIPAFDIDDLFSVFATSLKDVHTDAEKIVKAHASTLDNKSAETWLSQGKQFDTGETCPYCAQSTKENKLIQAYQTHFNAAYGELKAKVASLASKVSDATSANVIDKFSGAVSTASTHTQGWREQVEATLIEFNSSATRVALDKLRELLCELVEMKLVSPTDPIGTIIDKQNAIALWEQITSHMRLTNETISQAATKIDIYKNHLISENVQQLQIAIKNLQKSQLRHTPEVVLLINQYTTARANAVAANKKKDETRNQLNELMAKTLSLYEARINELLKKFGASFVIKGLDSNYLGGTPRSEYQLELRGKSVALEGSSPSFSTALSEGDKRTLAFAFFVASTMANSKLSEKVVVIDDPMCSLDMNRRQHTKAVLKDINSHAEQLIVLAHDAYFLRDLRDELLKPKNASEPKVFQLISSAGNYSNFSVFDLDQECESEFVKNCRLLGDFLIGSEQNYKSAAIAIRPLLEGYLRRRFPRAIQKNSLFGEIVRSIGDSDSSSPLQYAKNLTHELNEINNYAGKFHHDTNPDASRVLTTHSKVMSYVDRTLNLIHKGAHP